MQAELVNSNFEREARLVNASSRPTSALSSTRYPWTVVSHARPASTLTHAGSETAPDDKNSSSTPWRNRPKSTPLIKDSHHLMFQHPPRVRRLQTAVFSGHIEYDRVRQLEHEPIRQHKLGSHFPLKRAKPPPWQKSSEAPVMQLQLGHGYILSKTKTGSHVTLKDEFFEPSVQESSRKRTGADAIRDNLIEQLQQQICDLTLYLQDERLSHRQTKHKAEQILTDKIDHMNSQFQDQIRDMKAEHQDELLQLKQRIQSEHIQVQNTLENQISRMAKEIEFLQSAFVSYKGTLHTEATQKCTMMEDEHKLRFAEEKQQAVHETKTKLIQEWNQERTNLAKEHQKAIEAIRTENKKEMDGLIHRFSNAAADLQKLKETTALLEETKLELESLKDSYSTACQQLASITNQLKDTKVRLVDFEERFEDKVLQVDARFTHRLQELMTQNTELKRLFVQKCGQLFDEKANSDYKRAQRVKSARGFLEMLVKSKQRANLSTALGGPAQKMKCSRNRPLSAPGTRGETKAADGTARELDIIQAGLARSCHQK